MSTEDSHIKVIVRARPFNRREMEQNQRRIVNFLDKQTLLFDPEDEDDEFFFQGYKQTHRDITKRVNKNTTMEFDRVFDHTSLNEQIFEETMQPLVNSLLNGYNCSVFVYGATGAGKTFTMLGSNECLGLTYLTMQNLFDKMADQRYMRKFDLGISYLEVYNEQVRNLLTKEGPLKLLEDSNGVVVSGLLLKAINTADELLNLLALGNCNRTQHPTDANAESSRSHAIFQVHVRITDVCSGLKRTVKLSMIDLAGSERASSTKGIGLRFKEGACINKSLLALGNCINKLADGNKHIPYRDSNLTRILKDSLGGNCRTLMIANISMSSLTYEDTYNTLRYASRAKKIRSTARQNELKSNMPKEFYMKKVNEATSENDELRKQIKNLQAQLLGQNPATLSSEELKKWYTKIDATYESIMNVQDHLIEVQSKIKRFELKAVLCKHEHYCCNILVLRKTSDEHNRNYNLVCSLLKKDIQQQNEIGNNLRKKWQYGLKDLKKLKQDVGRSKYADTLNIYLDKKEIEMQNRKLVLYKNHLSLVNSELSDNTMNKVYFLAQACKILQKHFETHTNSESRKTIVNFREDLLFNRIRKPDECDDAELPTAKKMHFDNSDKAQSQCPILKMINVYELEKDLVVDAETTDNELSSEEEQEYFKVPKAPSHNTADSNINKTFKMDDASSTSHSAQKNPASVGILKKTENKNYINSLLSEQNVNMPANNKKHAQNALLKSKTFTRQGLMNAMASAAHKENKKHSPSRIRRSPRAINSALSKAHASTATNPLMRKATAVESSVRTNRAAQFRAKK